MAAKNTMRALVLTKPADALTPSLSLSAQHPVPVPPPGHLLVRIHASAIQPSDIINSKGGFGHTSFPRIPGRDFSGVVVASGDPEGSPLLDTPVFGSSGSTHAFSADGFQADYAVVPADGVAPKPEMLSHAQAAVVGVPFSTAALVVKKTEAKKGDTVLVIGANGAVGSAACAILEVQGCRVIRAVRGPGGDVDTSADPELKAVRQSLAPKGVDAVIDTVGMPSLTRAAVDDALGFRGRVVFIAAPRTNHTAELSFLMLDFYRAEKTAIGVNTVAHSSAEMAALLRDMGGVFESGKWKQLIGSWEEVRLDDAVAAYSRAGKDKKYVITMV